MNQRYKTAYLAAPGYEKQLADEIQGEFERYDRLFLTVQEPQNLFWAQNIWYEPVVHPFESISEAAAILKKIQRNWAFYPYTDFRRAALIEAQLPYISKKPLKFPVPLPTTAMGSWTLLDKNRLLASAHCTSLFRNGEVVFEECREEPPSRAYLKLWEAFLLAGKMPSGNQQCLEIGASPGGWTWVLAKTGAKVFAVDRAELAPQVVSMPNVHFQQGNGFAMTPNAVGAVDWIFSDVACYPEKLLPWVKDWVESGLCHNFICTLKFQGDSSYEVAKEFAAIPESRVIHLSHNKHELTWIRVL